MKRKYWRNKYNEIKTTPSSRNEPHQHRYHINLWNPHPRQPSNLRPSSLSAAISDALHFICITYWKTATRTRAHLLHPGGASQLFPAQMSLMKLWPWPPVTLFWGRLSHKLSASSNSLHVCLMIWSQAVFPRHTCFVVHRVFVCIIPAYSHNEPLTFGSLCSLINLFIFC